ncbi:MAG: ABC transporter permease [Candidatus Sungbacteria bacterium]|nr:ABC transporter permease [Candidatus Sungbacteria bacterium]
MQTLHRIFKAGFLNFRRNVWLSVATIMVMALVLFVLGNLVFLSALANSVISSLESRIDISVYFTQQAPEKEIFAVKQALEENADVADVTYVSRDIALAQFRERHKNNALIVSALEEIGENPLEASLNVKAKDPSRFAAISEFLAKKNYPAVDKINYFENEKVVERLGSILATIRGSGALLLVFLACVAMLVAFNTIRLVIYTMREEIGIMRLVGGTSWFIRGPFLVSGALYGLIATVLIMLAFFPLTWFFAPKLMIVVPEFNLFAYFVSHLVEFFGILLAAGVGIGMLSSFVAVRRYLKV